MKNWTTQQQAIFDFAAQSTQSLIVEADAGTGKTSTAVELLQRHPQCRAIFLAFNTHIAKELAERVPDWVQVRTLNSVGMSAWATFTGKKMQLEKNKTLFQGMAAVAALGIPDPEREHARAFAEILTQAKTMGIVFDGQGHPTRVPRAQKVFFDATPENWEIAWDAAEPTEELLAHPELVDKLNYALAEGVIDAHRGIIDFTDQIYMSCCYGGNFNRFELVGGDEIQDWSALQIYMAKKMVAKRFIGFGDSKQGIYMFRGAAGQAVRNLQEQFNAQVLHLNVTFRCGKAIVAANRWHAPAYEAAPSNPEGWVIRYEGWGPSDILPGSAIICRNGGPLLDIGFKLLANRIPIRFLKSSLSEFLGKLIIKISGGIQDLTREEFFRAVEVWQQGELLKSSMSPRASSIAERIEDRVACMRAIPGETVGEIIQALREIFANRFADVTLTTGHGAKGLEWDHVYHLDSWRLPSRYAVTDAQLNQEANLRYVIETRPKLTLAFINSDKFISGL